MLSQLKMNPDPAYQNRLLPERDNASFFDGYSVWFYKEQGDLQQANAFTLEFEIAPFGISSEGDAIFSCMDRKTSEGMAVRLTSDRKVEVILGFGGRQMVFYSIRENVDLEKWNHIFVTVFAKAGVILWSTACYQIVYSLAVFRRSNGQDIRFSSEKMLIRIV